MNEVGSEDRGYTTGMVVPPDGGYGWVIVAVCFIGCVFMDGLTFSFSLFRRPIAEDFHIDEAEVQVMAAIFLGTFYIGGIFACSLANWLNFRVLMVAGSIFLALCLAMCALFLNHILQFYIVYGIIGGLAGGLIVISANLPPGFYFDAHRPIALGIASSGTGFGAVCIPLVTELVMKAVDWRNTILFHAGLFVVLAFLGLLLRPLKPIMVHVTAPNFSPDVSEEGERVLYTTNLDTLSTMTTPHSMYTADMHSGYPTLSKIVGPSRISIDLTTADKKTVERVQKMATVRHPIVTSVSEQQLAGLSTTTLITSRNRRSGPTQQQQPVKWYLKCCKCFKKSRSIGARPLYQTDILYTGSLMRLSTYTTRAMDLEFKMSMIRPPTPTEIREEMEGRFVCCPEAVRRALKTLIDLSLLKSLTFLCLGFSSFFLYVGFYIPFLYIVAHCSSYGMSVIFGTTLISISGGGNAIGRILSGFLTIKFPALGARYFCIFTAYIAALCVLAVIFTNYSIFLICVMFVYGFTVGFFAPLRSIIIVDFMGLDKLTSCTGMVLIFQGIGSMIGLPVSENINGGLQPPSNNYISKQESYSEILMKLTSTTNSPFIFGAACIFIAASILLPIKKINKWENRRKHDHFDC